MRARWVTLVAFAAWTGACGTSDSPASTDPGAGACVPGDSKGCVGVGPCQGAQVCNADGRSYGACVCGSVDAGGTGGGTPDAGPDVVADADLDVSFDAKKDAQKDAGADSHTCGGATCETIPDDQVGDFQGCCSIHTKCGYVPNQYQFIGIGGFCVEKDQPGAPDPTCPTLSTGQYDLQGCCTPRVTAAVSSAGRLTGQVSPSPISVVSIRTQRAFPL